MIETRQDGRLNVERVKAITGGDPIRARFLHGNPFTFQPTHTVWLATNHKPRVPDDGHAIWRRLLLIPFTVTIPADEKDPEIDAKLAAEADGILSWIVQGALDYQQRGLDPPETVVAATSNYRDDENTFSAFLAERTAHQPGASTKAAVLHKAYQSWADENAAGKLSSNAIAEKLHGRGYERRHTNRGARWHGLRLRHEHTLDEGL